jgi:hypothetical protein
MSGNKVSQSIGGIATEKVPTTSLNVGFPSAYQSVYASKGKPLRFFPEAQSRPPVMLKAEGLQSDWHTQKKADADTMAKAKVVSQQMASRRAGVSHAGYFGMPKPVLGQRKFANPSFGALSAHSAREDQPVAPFHYAGSLEGGAIIGGVLRSPEGQDFGKKRLLARIGELNRIGEAKMAWATGLAPPTTPPKGVTFEASEVGEIGEATLIELNLMLQSVLDALVGSDGGEDLGRFSYAEATRALKVIFRIAPSVDMGELNELFSKVDVIVNLLNGVLEHDHHSRVPDSASQSYSSDSNALVGNKLQIALSLQVLFTKMREYLTRMLQGINLSPKERLALSKNLVKSLGFSKILKYGDDEYNQMLSEADRARLLNAQQAGIYRDVLQYGDPDAQWRSAPTTREDDTHRTETGATRSSRDFYPDERTSFGYNSGRFFPTNGRSVAWFGEMPPPEPSVASMASMASTPTSLSMPTATTGLSVGQIPPRQLRPNPQEFAFQGTGALRGFFDPDTQAFNVSASMPKASRKGRGKK